MCERQMTYFQARLQAAEFELIKQMGDAVEADSMIPAEVIPLSAGFSAETAGSEACEYILLSTVRVALSRMEAGEYGYCEGCGIEIGLKRLENYPVACLCVECRTLETVRSNQESG